MAAEYKLIWRTAAGVKVAEITDFLALSYRKRVNAPGVLGFELNGQHRALALLSDKMQIEVWRRDVANGIGWYLDFVAIYQADEDRKTTDRDVFVAQCPGAMTMLSWRHVGYAANTPNRSTFAGVAAETIMKTLVSTNAGANATTANGRVRTPASLGITVETDLGRGTVRDWNCAWKNVLGELQALAKVAGGDFDLVKTGPATWEFRFYPGQRGVDRTATLTFALGYGNMAEPVYRRQRINEKTVAIVGGQGQEAARLIVVRTGADYSATNDIEMFVDGRGDGSAAALNASGDQALDEARAREEFDFKILQTPGCLYGKHYCIGGVLGDLAIARYGTKQATQKLMAVTVSLDRSGKETIDVEAESV